MLTETIIEKALLLGASLAGIADVGYLKTSPSHRIAPRIGMGLEARWRDAPKKILPVEVEWPKDAVSAVVIGVAHPEDQPELDWYDGKGTPGNRILIRIVKELYLWLEETFSFTTSRPPYFIESGGVFMKDAAVLAGLGSIGKNNLVITPEYGPRIRWRVLLFDREAEASGPIAYNPCNGCSAPCLNACPVGAFDTLAYSASDLGQAALPGTDGFYERVTCNAKMALDVEDAAREIASNGENREKITSTMNAFEESVLALRPAGSEAKKYGVKYCRRCELSCPIGKK
jgi:epoxyqueuosine reductase